MTDTKESVGRGIWLVSTGHPAGLACFRGTFRAFIKSIIPVLTFSLITALILLQKGERHDALAQLAAAPIAALSGPLASHFVSVRLGREALWARYATAANWCQWGYVPFMLLALGLWTSGAALAPLALLLVTTYAIWLQLFLARYGLAIKWSHAVLVLVATASANLVLVMGPSLLVALVTHASG